MIDTILSFNSVQEANNDPVLSRHRDQLEEWIGSYVIPNLMVWRASQDINGTAPDGSSYTRHTYLPGWNILITLPHPVLSLFRHDNLRVMIDRDAVIEKRSGMIVKANVTQVVMQDIRWEPVFMGVEYPWGNWK